MKIMFVCTGNICRSAMAEGLMKKIVKENNMNIEVFSSGIYVLSEEHASYNSVAVMKEYDVDIALHKSKSIYNSNIEGMDLILCATQNHKTAILQTYKDLSSKVYTIKEFAEVDKNGEDMDVQDPWGYDLNTYRMCAAEISYCIDKIAEKLKSEE